MTTTTLRPAAHVDGFASTVSGAASVHAATNDNSDSSYVQVENLPSGWATVSFDGFTLPAGSVIRSVGCRYRARGNGGAAKLSGQLSLSSGGVLIDEQFDITSSFATYTGAQTFAAAAEADVDGLRLRVWFAHGTGTLPQIAELYVDVVHIGQPTTAVTAPTGTITDTTRPSISWGHTPGTDGGAQSRYRVKVFSAAQYGAGGFSPESSTATWDSGEQLGTTTTVAPDVDLADDTTYRAYVKTAQTVNGSPHWAEWDFEGFDVDAADPPGAPTLAVTADNANGRVRFVITAGTGAFDLYDLERSIDGGSTWSAVRGATRADPPGAVAIGYDYEAPNGESTQYRARAVNVQGDAETAGPWSTTASVTWSSEVIWIKDLRNASLNMAFDAVVLADEPVRVRRRGEHVVLGRRDPVIVSDVRQLTRGTVVFETETAARAEALLDLLDSDVVLLQSPPLVGLGSRYISPGDVQEIRRSQELAIEDRHWSIPFVEVAAPDDDGIEIPGVTYDDLAELYADYDAAASAINTYGELV